MVSGAEPSGAQRMCSAACTAGTGGGSALCGLVMKWEDGGTLAVAATGALAPMLRHVEAQIIERANRILGYAAVARISIEQGAATMAAPPPPLPPAPGPLPQATQSTLRDIADPELRATLQSLAEALASSSGVPKIR